MTGKVAQLTAELMTFYAAAVDRHCTRALLQTGIPLDLLKLRERENPETGCLRRTTLVISYDDDALGSPIAVVELRVEGFVFHVAEAWFGLTAFGFKPDSQWAEVPAP